MPKIAEKLEAIHIFIKEGSPDGQKLASEIQKLSTKAISGGMKSRDWESFMNKLSDCLDDPSSPGALKFDAAQLIRLIGEDETFNQKPLADVTLAYLPANGVCGLTTTTDTGRTMTGLLVMLDDQSADAIQNATAKTNETDDENVQTGAAA